MNNNPSHRRLFDGRSSVSVLAVSTAFVFTSLLTANANAEVEIAGGFTMVGLGASGVPATSADTGIHYSVDLELMGEVGDGNLYVYFNTSQGADVFPGSSADYEAGAADDGGFTSTGVAQAWYELPVMDSSKLTFGKIDPTGFYDGNEVANDQTTQFLAVNFVNNPTIPFPVYSFGLNFGMEFSEDMVLNIGMYEADPMLGSMERVFLIGEIATKMELMGSDTNIRLTYWQIDWENDPGTGVVTGSDSGYALNMDYNMEPLMLFLRYGTATIATDSPFELESAASAGLSYNLDDGMIVGLGYSQETPVDVTMDSRTWMEAYVSLELAENVAFSLDYQTIDAPNFSAVEDSISIYGVRMQVGF